jgi:hypothetical protein
MKECYPSRRGVPINPIELGLPKSDLDPESLFTNHNHHAAFEKRAYGRSVLLTTFRNLGSNQYGLPLDTHRILHDKYGPPVMPTLEQAYSNILENYDEGGELRYGSFNKPHYRQIGLQLLKAIDDEYNGIDIIKLGHNHNRNVSNDELLELFG